MLCKINKRGGFLMTKKLLALIMSLVMALGITSCGSPQASQPAAPADKPQNKTLVVDFAQIGQESGWRDAETFSILGEAEKLGVDLKFSDAQQKQENQIKAIRTFIQQKVDVIGVAPVVETGWETVFKEAKYAGIPIILVDRRAKVSDDLFATFIGSDFILEGKNAADEMAKLLNNKGDIVELQGDSWCFSCY